MTEFTDHEIPQSIKKPLILLYRKSGFPIRPLILNFIKRHEGGEFWSQTIREIFNEVHQIKIGIGSYGCFRFDAFPSGTVIGNYCSIAANVRVIGSNHPYQFVSTHPMFYYSKLGFVKEEKINRVSCVIGHDVWIGYNSLILAGCQRIGIGAVIAAGSVVTKDVDPFTIVAGVPAKPLKKRFGDDIARDLIKSEWYLLKPQELLPIIKDANDPQLFVKKIKNHHSAIYK